MVLYWIWLSRCKGLSAHKKLELCDGYHGPKGVYDTGLLSDKDLTPAQNILEDCRRLGVQILTAGDSLYPQRLLEIADPPLVLYYKGSLPEFDREAAIGVVGTRRASAYGLLSAERLARQISEHGGLVVSGMAAGIDTQAAWGALRAGKPTVAVLGGGVDQIYPTSNRDLYEAVAQQGCILSEYPPGIRPTNWTFPRRNRIISGLSVGVLAVEAPEKSGTLITVRDAKKQGRDIYAVPGHIDSAFCAGSNALLREGAKAVLCGWDALCSYQDRFADKLHRDDPPWGAPMSVTEQEQAVLNALAEGEMSNDQIIAVSGLSPQQTLAVLTVLEIKGMVKTLPGGRAIRNS